MSLKEVRADLKAKHLPRAFIPRGTSGAIIAVNANEPEYQPVCDVMTRHGYRRIWTYTGVDTDYQLTFERGR